MLKRLRSPTIILVAIICVTMLGLQGWVEWSARNTLVKDTETSVLNLASSLAQQAEDTIQIADGAVISVVKQVEANGTSTAAFARLEQILLAQRDGLVGLRDIVVLGSDGRWLATSMPATATSTMSKPVRQENLAGRVYFVRHRDDPKLGLFISPPIKSVLTGQWIVTVSRRFKSADGGFGGVVLAIINVSTFIDHYAQYDLGPASAITLSTTDGTMLGRYPSAEEFIGQTAPNATVVSKLRESPSGSYRNVALVDGVHRFVGYSRSHLYPVVAIVAMSEDDALAAWRAGMLIHMLIAVVLAAALGLLGLHLNRQMRRVAAAERAFRKTEEYLDRAGRLAGVGAWELDLVHDTVYWSPQTCRIHGVAAGYQPTTKTAFEFFTSDARPVIASTMAQCTADGAGWDLELPSRRADGRAIWVRIVGSLVWAAGKPSHLIGAYQDVTERIARRVALQTANDRITLATDSGGIGIWDWDVVMDEMVWDAAIYRVLGTQPPNEILTYSTWKRQVHPEDRAAAEHAMQLALQGQAPCILEFRVIWDDGSVHHLRGAGHVTRDATGGAIRIIGTLWDVTELVEQNSLRAQAQREASLAAARYRVLADNASDVMFIVDRRHVRLYVSPSCREMLGYEPEELTGAAALQTIHPEDAERVTDIYRAMFGGLERAATTNRIRHREGHFVWVDAAFKLIRDLETGEPLEISGSLREIG